jgi:hypothetical protein
MYCNSLFIFLGINITYITKQEKSVVNDELKWKHAVVNTEMKFGFSTYGSFLDCIKNN